MAKTRTIRLRPATFNAPESFKSGLLTDKVARARRVFEVFIRNRVDVAAMQEAGTFAEQVDNEVISVKALWAHFNDFVKGRQIGNGALIKHWRWKSHLLEDIKVGQGDNAIYIAVVLLTKRWSRKPAQFKYYCVHKPTRTADNAHLRPVIDRVLVEHTRRDDAAGMPWMVAGDFNGPFDLGRRLADHGVDSIRGSTHFTPVRQMVLDRPNLSDHPFLVAVVDFKYKVA